MLVLVGELRGDDDDFRQRCRVPLAVAEAEEDLLAWKEHKLWAKEAGLEAFVAFDVEKVELVTGWGR